jgi:hypothetical protein
MQSTSKLVMVRPDYFGPNNQTASSNVFQTNSGHIDKCKDEWIQMRDTLSNAGLDIIEFDALQNAPDAIFPNWFATFANGTMDLFSMESLNRQIERNNPSLTKLLDAYSIEIDYAKEQANGIALESTSSLVLDRKNKIAFCSISTRSNKDLAEDWAFKRGYQCITFHSYFKNQPIYHTNVVMWIGTNIVGICPDVIDIKDRDLVLSSIPSNKEIMRFTKAQLEAYCGNMLEIRNKDNQLMLLMSKTACQILTVDQRRVLDKHYSKLLVIDLHNIEKIGGGSARCMVQELY